MLKQGFATKKAAQTALADVVSGNTKGSVVSRTTIRVEAVLTEWLETVRSRLRPTTFHSYEMAVTASTAPSAPVAHRVEEPSSSSGILAATR